VSNFLKNLGAIKWHLEVMEVKSIGEAALAQEKRGTTTKMSNKKT